MQKSPFRAEFVFLLSCVTLVLSGCQASETNVSLQSTPPVVWQVEISEVVIVDNLDTVESVTQYDGSKIDVVHKQSPEPGNVYLIMNVTVKKTDNQSSTPFDWQQLLVNDDAGISYNRLENDTFLEQHQYSPRMTGLEIRFGENTGWLCYEIPASSATGKLVLSYKAEESKQEIVLQK
jgi:hypothetical protein